MISQRITAILKDSLENPNDFSRTTPWSTDLLTYAIGMWLTESIVLNVTTRRTMAQYGLKDTVSFSSWDSGVLRITAGFLEEAEMNDANWNPLSALL